MTIGQPLAMAVAAATGKGARSVIGGGDSASAIENLGLADYVRIADLLADTGKLQADDNEVSDD